MLGDIVMFDQFSDFLKVILQISQVVALIYAGYKFTRQPHDTLENQHKALERRVDAHDIKFKEVEDSLKQGNDRFREQKDLNKVFITSMLAFIDFERAYCANSGYTDTADLDKAKKTLQDYLSER